MSGLLLLVGLLLRPFSSQADAGLYRDYVSLKVVGGGGGPAAPRDGTYRYYTNKTTYGLTPFGGAELGTFNPALGSQLLLAGAEANSFQRDSGRVRQVTVTSAALRYRLYPMGSTPGAFQALDLRFAQAGLDDTPSNQQWLSRPATLDLLALATQPGRYVLEVYFEAQGNSSNGAFTVLDDQAGLNYQATFTVLPAAEGLVADSTELRVLRDFYTRTNGTRWRNHAGWPTSAADWAAATLTQAATWHGLNVSGGDVTALVFGNDLSGELPPSLGLLAGLQTINIQRGAIEPATTPALGGTLPKELGQLQRLRTLMLRFTEVGGSLPPELSNCQQLRTLWLINNRFTGLIPPELGQLTNLEVLNLENWYVQPMFAGYRNTFTGGIPPALGQLHNLTSLALDMNPLGGSIPPELGQLRKLTFLELDDARLSGEVPAAVLALPQLRTCILGAQNYGYSDPNTFSHLPATNVLANAGSLQLLLERNQFDFEDLEPYFTGPGQLLTGPGSTYLPQSPPVQRDHYASVLQGQLLQLPARQQGTRTHYQWQRLVGSSWQDLAADTSALFERPTVALAEAGRYRCQTTNRWVTGLTFTEAEFVVDVRAAGPRNLPDDTNPGLALVTPDPAPDATAPTPADVNYVRSWVPRVALTDASAAAPGPAVAPGIILREQWDGVPGETLAAIPRDTPPTSLRYLTALEAPTNVGDNYGARIRGYLLAPETGTYTFWLASDDQGELWLSTDADPAHQVRLAWVDGWTYPHAYNTYGSQQSADVALVKGQRYYLEVRHKEGGGGDHVSVAWRRPTAPGGGSTQYEDPLPGQYLQPLQLPVSGVLLREQWDNVLPDSLGAVPFQTPPTSSSYLTALEAPTNVGDHYGARLRGYLLPPLSGTYILWLASDDQSELWLSPDEDPAHKVKRAFVRGYTDPHQYEKYTWEPGVGQQRVDLPLAGGQRYYFEIRHKENAGGDHVSVAWSRPGPGGTRPYEAPIPGQYLAPPGAAASVPAAGEPTWSREQAQVTTQYLDGLGRPLQTVQHQASPDGQFDLVQPQAYDGLGREPRQYLPYPDSSKQAPGRYRPRAIARQADFYARTGPVGGGIGPLSPGDATTGVVRTGAAFAETQFEASPLNRVLAQGAAGEAWQLTQGQALPTSHVQRRLERPNVATDSVPRFTPGYSATSLDPGYQGTYAEGELWGTQVSDEQGTPSLEWKDKLGQIVCKQVASARSGSGASTQYRWLRTAYAYDDFQHLRFVLQPEATKRVLALGTTPAPLPTACLPYLFHYRYDGRGRQIAKQVPGQDGETLVVYDQLDRPVLSQDAQQRTRKEWSWTKYDALGRVVLTGLVTRADTLGQVSLQNVASADTATSHQYEQRTASPSAAPYYYSTTQAFPRLGQGGFGPGLVLTATHYDDYDFDNDGQANAHYSAISDAAFAVSQAPVADEARVTGLATHTLTRVLNRPAIDPGTDWLATTTFYDERARVIQVQSLNARDSLDVVTMQLDFLGKPLRTVARHGGPSHAPVQVVETSTYDPVGRLLRSYQQLPDEAQPSRVRAHAYNALGQLRVDSLATGRLTQAVQYAYNPRGWLTQLNDPRAPRPQDLFNLSLHYEAGFTRGYEQYNGNLTGQTWRGRDGVQRAYGYDYDAVNRLRQGDYVARTSLAGSPATGSWQAEADNYRLAGLRYDDNGNILALSRRGLLQKATHAQAARYGAVDNLSYTYQGNRLLAVDDAVSGNQLPQPVSYHGAPTSLAGDFQEQGVQLGQEYLYDANGNLTQDKNKGITGILYNHLNLPRQIHFGQVGDSVVFRYTASGQKVAKLVYQTGKATPQRTDYLGPYQYEGDSLRFFPHAAGRVLRFVSKDPAGQATVSYQREFTIKDHLGNLRLAYRAGQVRRLLATLEQDADTHKRESQQFDSLSVSAPIAFATPLAYGGGSYVAKLNAGGNAPQPLGPLTQLGVQKGDTVTVSAFGYYPQPTQHGFFFTIASFIAQLVGQQPSTPPGELSRGRKNLPLLQVGVAAGLSSLTQAGNGVPLGYLRVLVFDKDSALVPAQCKLVQLTQAAHGGYEPVSAQVLLAQDGYVTAYVGNESDVDVYFDNVAVEHRSGLQVQETQYDPAGLELAGLAAPSPGIRGLNNYRFNGKEFQADLGLNWNHQDWRFLDPQLLRWHSVDPEVENGQESWTPYSFSYDNAVRYADANGRCPNGCPPSEVESISNYLLGATVALIDNVTLGTTKVRELAGRHATSPVDFNGGLIAGDIGTLLLTAGEEGTGDALATGGLIAAVPTEGAGLLVAAGGQGLALHGKLAGGIALLNFATQKGHLPLDNKDGNNKPTRNERIQAKKEKNSSKNSKYGEEAEHRGNASESNRNTHEKGLSRKARDKGGEKGDAGRTRYQDSKKRKQP